MTLTSTHSASGVIIKLIEALNIQSNCTLILQSCQIISAETHKSANPVDTVFIRDSTLTTEALLDLVGGLNIIHLHLDKTAVPVISLSTCPLVLDTLYVRNVNISLANVVSILEQLSVRQLYIEKCSLVQVEMNSSQMQGAIESSHMSTIFVANMTISLTSLTNVIQQLNPMTLNLSDCTVSLQQDDVVFVDKIWQLSQVRTTEYYEMLKE